MSDIINGPTAKINDNIDNIDNMDIDEKFIKEQAYIKKCLNKKYESPDECSDINEWVLRHLPLSDDALKKVLTKLNNI